MGAAPFFEVFFHIIPVDFPKRVAQQTNITALGRLKWVGNHRSKKKAILDHLPHRKWYDPTILMKRATPKLGCSSCGIRMYGIQGIREESTAACGYAEIIDMEVNSIHTHDGSMYVCHINGSTFTINIPQMLDMEVNSIHTRFSH